MITTYLNTFIIILYVSLIIYLIDLLTTKLRFADLKYNKSVISYKYHKFIYNLQNTEINTSFFIKFLLQTIFYIVLFLPTLYYSKGLYGSALTSLISSMQERDFLFVWMNFSSLIFLRPLTKSLTEFKQDIRVLINNFIFLTSIFIIISTEGKLSISIYDVETSLVTIIAIACVLVMARYVFSKNSVEVDETNAAIKEIKTLNQKIFLFSLTTIAAATILRVLSLHIDINLENVLPLAFSSVLFFLFSFEKKVWKNIDIFQRDFLELKYQFPVQFIMLGFLCCMYYFL